jgi:hypothetical protein
MKGRGTSSSTSSSSTWSLSISAEAAAATTPLQPQSRERNWLHMTPDHSETSPLEKDMMAVIAVITSPKAIILLSGSTLSLLRD